MQDWAQTFYFSPAWRQCRDAYAKQAGGLCERCLARGLFSPGEIVHHKIHLTPENITQPEIALSFDNLELVCRACHADEHQRIARRYHIGEDGTVMTSPLQE